MKFSLLSDVHLEFYKENKILSLINSIKNKIAEKRDILLLAGDIGRLDSQNNIKNYKLFLNSLSPYFEKMFLISGNHEYYGLSIYDGNEQLNLLKNYVSNLEILNNKSFVLNRSNKKSLKILGSIMWGDTNLDYYSFINDFYEIKDFCANANEYIYQYKQNKLWLDNELNNSKDDYELIIMTHHLPSQRLSDTKYKKFSHLNSYFCSNLDYLFDNQSIKYWIYGHTHSYFNNKLSNCHINFICNPYGYPNENELINYVENFEI